MYKDFAPIDGRLFILLLLYHCYYRRINLESCQAQHLTNLEPYQAQHPSTDHCHRIRVKVRVRARVGQYSVGSSSSTAIVV